MKRCIDAIKIQLISLIISLFVILSFSSYAGMNIYGIAVNLSISLGAGAFSAFILAISDYYQEQVILKKLVRKYKITVLSLIDDTSTSKSNLYTELKKNAVEFRNQVSLYAPSPECDDFLMSLGKCLDSFSPDSIAELRREANKQKN